MKQLTNAEEERVEREMRQKQHDEDLTMLTDEKDFIDFTPVWKA